MISSVYDSCVLYSASLRDLVMNIAVARLVRAHWSNEIHEDWIRSLLRNQPTLQRERLERTRRNMDRAVVEGGLVSGYEERVSTLRLPDPNDRHVLALAIHVKASWIVTFNLSDFPVSELAPHEIEAVSPDEFVLRLAKSDEEGLLEAIRVHRTHLYNPPKSVGEYLATLQQQRLHKTVAFLQKHRDEI